MMRTNKGRAAAVNASRAAIKSRYRELLWKLSKTFCRAVLTVSSSIQRRGGGLPLTIWPLGGSPHRTAWTN